MNRKYTLQKYPKTPSIKYIFGIIFICKLISQYFFQHPEKLCDSHEFVKKVDVIHQFNFFSNDKKYFILQKKTNIQEN